MKRTSTFNKPTRKVYARYWPERLGVILKEGPEVSEVKWADGGTDFISNEKLVIKPERLKIDKPKRLRIEP